MNNKRLLITLIISATLNLMVAGAVLGHFLKGGPEPRFPGHLGRVLENIDPVQRDALKVQFADFRQDGRKLHREMRQQQRELTRIILEQPFDEASAREGFAQLRQRGNAIQTQMHEQMIIVMRNLNPEQRARLIKRINKAQRGGAAHGERTRHSEPKPD
jgi:uncharacterized membrane protein